MDTFFHENIPMGLTLKILKILGVFVAKSQEMGTFWGKIPRYGYLFLEKLPLKMGLELLVAHPRPIQI